MYTPPKILSCTRALSSETVDRAKTDVLAWTYDATLREVVQAAVNSGEILDPDTIIVKITVEARAL